MKNKSTVEKLTFKSSNGNRYLLSRKVPQVLLLHPVMNHFLVLREQGIDIETWIKNADIDNGGIEDYPDVRIEELHYYHNLYRFLESNGYFDDVKQENWMEKKSDARGVEYHLANTNQIVFEVTDACNLRCRYCGYGDLYGGHDKRENKTLDTDMAKRSFDHVVTLIDSPLNEKTHNRIAVSFFGGEPLMNMNLIKEMVDYSAARKLAYNEFCYSMTTNGVLLDKHMDYLVEKEFYLLISLDGDEYGNSYRVFANGKNSFQKVCSNIEALKNRFPEYFKKYVSFNAVRHNRNSLEETRRFFREKFDKQVAMAEMRASGIKEEQKEKFEEIHRQVPSDYIYKELKRKEFNGIVTRYSGYTVKKYQTLLRKKETVARIQTGTCRPFEAKIFITVNGKILPCERIKQTYDFGKVTDSSVYLDFEKVAEKYNAYHRKMKELCSRCFNNDRCSQCIFYLDLDKDKPHCDNFVSAKRFTEQLADTMSAIENSPSEYVDVMGRG
jgi:uncharacterized protein